MAYFIDIHSHLDHCKINLDSAIINANKLGVKKILSAGINHDTNLKALEFANKYKEIEACMGIYPTDKLEGLESEIKFIVNNKDKIVAIGECGLDYKEFGLNTKPIQEEIFCSQIELAINLKKPIIVHSRKAEESVLDMLESSGIKSVVLHCFCGKKKLVKRGVDLGYSFSIPTNVVNSQQFQQMIELVIINQLFCETDSPYLGPIKGEWNEPANVIESYKMISKIKGFELEEVKNAIFMNWQKMF